MRQVPESLGTEATSASTAKLALVRAGLKNRFLLALLGLLVVVGGFLVPELVGGKTKLSESAPEPAAAQKSSLTYDEPAPPESFDSRNLLARLAFGTLVVLGLCVATLWIAKRWLRGALPGNNGKGQLRTIESLALTYGCSLHLVQVGKQQVLAGVDRTGFKALLALTEPFEASLNAVQSAATSEMELPRIVPIGAHIN